MDRSAIEHLYEYTGWTWEQIGGALKSHDEGVLLRSVPGSGWPALRDCFVHYLFALDRWLAVLLSRPGEGIEATEYTTWGQIDAKRTSSRGELKSLFDSLGDEELGRLREFQIDGGAMPYSYAELLTHVLVHERGHHGDVTTLLYQLGIEAPPLDYRWHLARRAVR